MGREPSVVSVRDLSSSATCYPVATGRDRPEAAIDGDTPSQKTERKKVGLLTSVVIADFSDAKAIEQSSNPVETWEGFDARGIDPVKLEQLQLLVQKESSTEQADVTFPLLAGADEGPWVFGFPQGFTALLAKLTPPTLLQVTRQWLETDELLMDNWQLQETRTVLTSLQCVAQKALAQNRSLIICISM